MANPERMPLVWLAGLDGKRKDDFESLLRNSTQVLGKLKGILLDRLATIEEDELRDEFFELPNLTARLTRNASRKKELRDTLKLLSFF